jgi:hypothetical protein
METSLGKQHSETPCQKENNRRIKKEEEKKTE